MSFLTLIFYFCFNFYLIYSSSCHNCVLIFMSSTLIAALLSICMFACMCVAAAAFSQTCRSVQSPSNCWRTTACTGTCFRQSNIQGIMKCYVIIRGIKADDEFKSNSCVPVDLSRRSPSARPSFYTPPLLNIFCETASRCYLYKIKIKIKPTDRP